MRSWCKPVCCSPARDCTQAQRARVTFSRDERTITDGPFAETKELIAGYWLIDVKSKEEGIEWARRIPFQEGEVELRQVFETSDFPFEILCPQAAAREEELREELQRKATRS
jgi:YCII-related domain